MTHTFARVELVDLRERREREKAIGALRRVAEAELGSRAERNRRAARVAERREHGREIVIIARLDRRIHGHAVDRDRIVEAQRVPELRRERFQVAHRYIGTRS